MWLREMSRSMKSVVRHDELFRDYERGLNMKGEWNISEKLRYGWENTHRSDY